MTAWVFAIQRWLSAADRLVDTTAFLLRRGRGQHAGLTVGINRLMLRKVGARRLPILDSVGWSFLHICHGDLVCDHCCYFLL